MINTDALRAALNQSRRTGNTCMLGLLAEGTGGGIVVVSEEEARFLQDFGFRTVTLRDLCAPGIRERRPLFFDHPAVLMLLSEIDAARAEAAAEKKERERMSDLLGKREKELGEARMSLQYAEKAKREAQCEVSLLCDRDMLSRRALDEALKGIDKLSKELAELKSVPPAKPGPKERVVGEVFRSGQDVLQVKPDSGEGSDCSECYLSCPTCRHVGRQMRGACGPLARSDKQSVHFVRVTGPEEGMLFRASDGGVYRLEKQNCLLNPLCACWRDDGLRCQNIDKELFGKILEGFHWVPQAKYTLSTESAVPSEKKTPLVLVEGNLFFYVSGEGRVCLADKNAEHAWDIQKRIDFHNYFKTQESAQAASDAIRELLKGLRHD